MSRFKLVFFIPSTDTRRVLDAFFNKLPQEAGRIGRYEQCAFITRGTGQFKSSEGASPNIGTIGNLETVEEDRVEVVIRDKGGNDEIKRAIAELKKIHPYEEIAYDVYRLEDL